MWGTGTPGEKVTVSFGNQTVDATVDADGRWKLHLAPMEANANPQTLEITSNGGESFAFTDVLVGEVWLCSGQSNMEMPLWTDNPRWRNINGDKFAAVGGNPLIRVARMVPYKWLPLPSADFPMAWNVLTPENAPSFSAVANQPLPPAPAFPEELAPMNSHQQATALYNSMIYPFVPFAMRGTIWYQGCSNLGDGEIYRHKMQALFNGWKQVFENPELKFYFVQLAPFNYGGNGLALPIIWEAQEQFCKDNEPQVGMAVINDIGDYGDIHPHNKKPVGERLANLALNRTYGRDDLKPDFPRPAACAFDGPSCILTFDNVTEWKSTTPDGTPSANDFEVAGMDGIFVHPNTVEMDGTTLKVTLPGGGKAFQVRYLWFQMVTSTLFNENGLPMGAFRFSQAVTEEDLQDALGNQTLVYQIDLCKADIQRGKPANYQVDHSASIQGKLKRVTYFLRATDKQGGTQWMLVGMDAFTQDATKIGIPTADSGASFQQKVQNLTVVTNAPGVASKTYSKGNIEFFPNNYAGNGKLNLPGNNDGKYDFDDSPGSPLDGYGSMQVHAFTDKLTLFAFNNFTAGTIADFGFGNSTGDHPDWTFSKNLNNYESVLLEIYVTLE